MVTTIDHSNKLLVPQGLESSKQDEELEVKPRFQHSPPFDDDKPCIEKQLIISIVCKSSWSNS